MTSICSFVPKTFLINSLKIKTLGSGTFGNVGLYKTSFGKYIIKDTKIHDRIQGYPTDFLNEVDILIKFRPVESIVKLEGVCFDDHSNIGHILMEPLDCNLMEWAQITPFEEKISELSNILASIGGALMSLHHFKFIHNDIKTNNILVRRKKDGYIFKLADFGSTIHANGIDIPYSGLKEYQPISSQNIFFSEFWAFMISMIEYLIGRRLIVSTFISDFYNTYIVDGKFLLDRVLFDILPAVQYQRIPESFFRFFEPILNGIYSPIEDSLIQMGIYPNTKVLNYIETTFPRCQEVHSDFRQIEDEYKHRFNTLGISSRFSRFSRLLNSFLFRSGTADMPYYAEVAFLIIARSRAGQLKYFSNSETLLSVQRKFLVEMGYQINIL